MSGIISEFFAKCVFGALGRGMKGVYKLDPDMRVLVEGLPEGYAVKLGISGTDTGLGFARINDALKVYRAKDAPDVYDLRVEFKSTSAALPMLSGRKSAAMAYAENDFVMKGDIFYGMNVVAMINLAESYLFPRFMLKRISDVSPKLRRSKLRIYTYFFTGV